MRAIIVDGDRSIIQEIQVPNRTDPWLVFNDLSLLWLFYIFFVLEEIYICVDVPKAPHPSSKANCYQKSTIIIVYLLSKSNHVERWTNLYEFFAQIHRIWRCCVVSALDIFDRERERKTLSIKRDLFRRKLEWNEPWPDQGPWIVDGQIWCWIDSSQLGWVVTKVNYCWSSANWFIVCASEDVSRFQGFLDGFDGGLVRLMSKNMQNA